MTTSMTLFCQLLALGRAPNKDRDRSIRSQLNSRCQLVSLLSLFIAIYIAKTKALLPTVWPVPNVSYNTVNLTTHVERRSRTRNLYDSLPIPLIHTNGQNGVSNKYYTKETVF